MSGICPKREGKGKARAVRIGTNIPQIIGNTWSYETDNSVTKYAAHTSPPSPLHQNATRAEVISHAMLLFQSLVYEYSTSQRSDCWRLARLFRWTSTSFHILVNVIAAPYFSTNELREQHAEILQIMHHNECM